MAVLRLANWKVFLLCMECQKACAIEQEEAIRSNKSEQSHHGKFWETDAIGKTYFQNSE